MKLCLAILGPTASGKSELALELAQALGGEIVCLDSVTVYRHFEIGAAKPAAVDRKQVPHHLLDIMDPNDEFSAFDFVKRADATLSEIHNKGKVPIIVGGTYFYLRALQNGMYPGDKVPPEIVESVENSYVDGEDWLTEKMHADLKAVDPQAAEKIHPKDRYRLVRALSLWKHLGTPPSKLQPELISAAQKDRLWMKYAIALPRHRLVDRVAARTFKMVEGGLLEETQKLLDQFPKARALSSVGYAEAVAHLKSGSNDKKALCNAIIEKTRQLAKRQITWIRSDPEIRFVAPGDIGRIRLEFNNLKYVLDEEAG
ncbi:MAG: tRNA (adenosine(37)-N6)-dimethylallyltransferase MiaA [Bdellovibrionales bacterium]|nr:tRNA (adenosine(37)-N6)-dimethylallyltransferase MiaA [Bdellovibrionales bacterium]